jgi:hypothetical protein
MEISKKKTIDLYFTAMVTAADLSLDFGANPFVRKLIDALRGSCDTGYTPPCPKTITKARGALVTARMEKDVELWKKATSVFSTNFASCMVDVWKSRSKKIPYFQGGFVTLLDPDTFEVAVLNLKLLSLEGSHSGKNTSLWIKKSMNEHFGDGASSKLTALTTDGASSQPTAAAEMSLHWQWCAAHRCALGVKAALGVKMPVYYFDTTTSSFTLAPSKPKTTETTASASGARATGEPTPMGDIDQCPMAEHDAEGGETSGWMAANTEEEEEEEEEEEDAEGAATTRDEPTAERDDEPAAQPPKRKHRISKALKVLWKESPGDLQEKLTKLKNMTEKDENHL